MTTKVERIQRYPVSARALLGMLTDQQFFVARFSMSGIDNYRFDTFEQQGSELVIRVSRQVSLRPGNVPLFARKFVGSSYVMTQEFIWTDMDSLPYRARYRFSVGNAPVDVTGFIEIAEQDGEAQQYVRVNISAHVPLVGNKIAALLAEKVESGMDSDYRATMRYIEENKLA